MQGFLETTTCVHILEGSRVVRQVVETVPPEPQLDEQETAGAIKLSRFLIAERLLCQIDVHVPSMCVQRQQQQSAGDSARLN